MSPYIAALLTFAIALVFLRLMDFLAHRGLIESRLSRKLIHIGTGPIFVLCWLMFTDEAISRWLAALVPLVITIQFALVGLGIVKDEAAVKAMSRTGDPREILRGPLFYGIVFVAMTLIYWKDSLIGIPALMILCGGDGVADIVGRRVQFPEVVLVARKKRCRLPQRFLRRLAVDDVHLHDLCLAGRVQRTHYAICFARCVCRFGSYAG